MSSKILAQSIIMITSSKPSNLTIENNELSKTGFEVSLNFITKLEKIDIDMFEQF